MSNDSLLFPDPKLKYEKKTVKKLFEFSEGISNLAFCNDFYSYEEGRALSDLCIPSLKSENVSIVNSNESIENLMAAITGEYEHRLSTLSKEQFGNVVVETINDLVEIQDKINALHLEMYIRSESIFPTLIKRKVDLEFVPDRKLCAKKMIIFRRLWKMYKSKALKNIGDRRFDKWADLDTHRVDLNGAGTVMEAYELLHYLFRVVLTRVRGNVEGHRVKGQDIVYITQMNIMWNPQIAEFWGGKPEIDFERVNTMSSASCKETKWGVMLRKEYNSEQSAKKLLIDLKEGMLNFQGKKTIFDTEGKPIKVIESDDGPMFRFARRVKLTEEGLKKSWARELAKGKIWNAINPLDFESDRGASERSLTSKYNIKAPAFY